MAASTKVKPIVVWVPGFLHTPEHFQPIISALAKVSIPSVSFSLPNVGAGAPTAAPYDDLKHLWAMLEGLVGEGKEVVLICHSYRGVPASQAIRGLQRAERERNGQSGVIIRIVFMAAFALPEGESTWTFTEGRQPPKWATREVSRTFFNGRSLRAIATAKFFSWGTSGDQTFQNASPTFSEISQKSLRNSR